MEPPKKHCKRITPLAPPPVKNFEWESPYSEVTATSNELGDGASSRVYLIEIKGKPVAVKRLKAYSPHNTAMLVKVYEQFFHLHHPKVISVLGICPKSGFVVLELCEKIIGDHIIENLMHLYGNELPLDVKIAALSDIAEGIEYLHKNSIIHGDVKSSNVLISADGDDDFIFKITDYACAKVTMQQSSHSTTLKQLMTPGYMAPELLPSNCHGLLTIPPNKTTDIYAFGVMAYEVVFDKPAWPNVSMALMSSVKNGLRPEIPVESDYTLSNLIKECWVQDPESQLNAATVFQILDSYLYKLQNEGISPITEIQDNNKSNIISAIDLHISYGEEQSTDTSDITTIELQHTELTLRGGNTTRLY